MGRNNADFNQGKVNLNDVEITHSYGHDELTDGSGAPNTEYTRHYFSAVHPIHGEIGNMQITASRNDHQIVGVDVHKNFRRQGIATAMYRKAISVGLTPRHSSSRTDDGDAWAKSVGGFSPKNTLK